MVKSSTKSSCSLSPVNSNKASSFKLHPETEEVKISRGIKDKKEEVDQIISNSPSRRTVHRTTSNTMKLLKILKNEIIDKQVPVEVNWTQVML